VIDMTEKGNKYLMICCFFIFTVNGLFAMVLGSLLPLISAEYGLSNMLSGTLLSMHQAGALAAGFLAGMLPYYMGRKKALLFLLTFVIIGFSIVIITGNPIFLLIGFLFTGISRGSISNYCNAIVNETSGGKTAALNFLHSLFAVGALLAPFLVIFSTNVAGDEGWKISVLVIIGFVAVSILMFARAKMGTIETTEKKQKLSYGFLKKRRIWYGIGIIFFYLCVEATVNGWIVTYFIDEGIMSRQYAQTLASVLWVVMLAGRLSIVFIGDRIAKRWIMLTAAVFTAAFYVMLLATRSIPMITIAIAGLGFSMAGIYPTLLASLSKTIKDYPQSLGVLLLLGGIGAIAMPTITGALSDWFGIFAGMSAVIVAIVLMLLFILLEIKSEKSEKLEISSHDCPM